MNNWLSWELKTYGELPRKAFVKLCERFACLTFKDRRKSSFCPISKLWAFWGSGDKCCTVNLWARTPLRSNVVVHFSMSQIEVITVQYLTYFIPSSIFHFGHSCTDKREDTFKLESPTWYWTVTNGGFQNLHYHCIIETWKSLSVIFKFHDLNHS